MLLISSPIPSIRIIPAPPEEHYPDPHSPFPPSALDVEDGYRANRLSLPHLAGTSPWRSSTLRRPNSFCKGLGQDHFSLLLKVSRDQRAKSGLSKIPDLRKELVLKNQNVKQLERRARFLSKVNKPSLNTTSPVSDISPESPTTSLAPFSPRGFEPGYSAVGIAEDSVAIISPTNPGLDEQVEPGVFAAEPFLGSSRFPLTMSNESRRISPSLDEITARLKPVHALSNKDSPSRPPNFLSARSFALSDETFDATFAQQVTRPPHANHSNLVLGSGCVIIPHTVDSVAESALYTNRAGTAREMIVILRRRSSPPPGPGSHKCVRTSA